LLSVSFADALIWLISMWFADTQNLVFFLIFVAGVLLWWQEKNELNILLSEKLSLWQVVLIVLAISIEIVNIIFLKYSILSIIIFVSLLTAFFLKRNPKISILFFLSIPASFYLNSIFGPMARKVYAEVVFRFVSIFTPGTVLDGTIVRTGANYINIDTGCSGILTMYHIFALSIFVSAILKIRLKPTILITILAWLIYCTFNVVQLLALAYMGNVLLYQNVQALHKVTANIVSIIGLCGVPVAFVVLKPLFMRSSPQNRGKLKVKRVDLKKCYIIVLLVFLLTVKLIIFINSSNKELNVLSVSQECVPNQFHIAYINKNMLNILQENSFSSYAYFEDGAGQAIIIGKTNSVNILANVGKIESAKGMTVETIRTEIAENGQRVRKITNIDGSTAYYLLANNKKLYLEFSLLDLFNSNFDGRFVYFSSRDDKTSNLSELYRIQKDCPALQ
jgi:exosortase/archaeosortase family protein